MTAGVRGLAADILLALREAPDGLTDRDLAVRLDKYHAQVHQTCERLAAKGLIVRDRSLRPLRNRALESSAAVPLADIPPAAVPLGTSGGAPAIDVEGLVSTYLRSRDP